MQSERGETRVRSTATPVLHMIANRPSAARIPFRGKAGLIIALGLLNATARLFAVTAEVIENRKIWDQGGHNAFTDLVRFKERWWCTFRESDGHVGVDGAIRIITSA